MAKRGKLAGAIISFLLSAAHSRVHRKVHVLASMLLYELELAKLARYSAGFSPQGRLNFLFLHSMHASKFLLSSIKGSHNNSVVGYKHRGAPGSPSPPPGHHKHLADNLACALHTQPCPALVPDPAPQAPSALHSPWEQLHPDRSNAESLLLRGEDTCVENLQLWRSASVTSFPGFKKDSLV